ncbi:MAG: hypothetical protein ACP5OP_06010 [Leptospirillia bacterium]
MIKSLIRGLLPFVIGLVILTATGLFVHLYRSTWTPGPQTEPRIPRAQTTFTLRLPVPSATPQGQPVQDWPLVLNVVKKSSAPLSVAYWPVGRTVLRMPLVVPAGLPGSPPSSVRLVLWDPGRYTLTLTDPATGRTVETLPLQVIAPLVLFRNDLFLLLALAVAGHLSGRFIRGAGILSPPAPEGRPFRNSPFGPGGLSRLLSRRKTLSATLLLAGILLVAFAPRPQASGPDSPAAMGPGGTAESEGRRDAARMPLFDRTTLPPGTPAGKGYLLLSHRMDSWAAYGHDLTLFSGPVDARNLSEAFLLPPDDGRYRIHLWETDSAGHLVTIRTVSRAIPVSPAFPVWLFSGLALISLAFFLLGATTPAVRSPATPLERLR